ncbi:hypothetical protein QR46_4561 [Giardia duodenalis assemblage B]|uniref:Uncharacterized protein n=1 Tax=Giardia duodenalis assemblage B TaxID=1394984 RepID=A0A132NN10_GIAIN|nr:hypothetical protein QR46_4561 [Giardia intestinalis assemblage B]
MQPDVKEKFQKLSTTVLSASAEMTHLNLQQQNSNNLPSQPEPPQERPAAITITKVAPVRHVGPLIEISSAESSVVSHIDSVDDAIYTAESRMLINEDSVLYESEGIVNNQKANSCLDVMREHLLIYIIIIILFLLAIILIILIAILYIKLIDLKVTNLMVTNRALVGYSSWSDPTILQASSTGQVNAPTSYSLITPSFLEQRSSCVNVTTVDTQLETLNSGISLANSALTAVRAFFGTINALKITFNTSLVKNIASATAALNATSLEISSYLNATTLSAEKLDVPTVHAQTMSLPSSTLTANTLVFTESMTVDTIAHRTLTVEDITATSLSVGGSGNTFSVSGGPVTVTPLDSTRGVNITAELTASTPHFTHIQSDSTEDTNLTISAFSSNSEINVSSVVVKDTAASTNVVSLTSNGDVSTLTVSGTTKPDTVLTAQSGATPGSVTSSLSTSGISCGSIKTTSLTSTKCVCDKNP